MSGEQRFQKTFTRRKKATEPDNNVNHKREKGKEKRVKVEDQVKEEAHANAEKDLAVPSSCAESQGRRSHADGEVARKPIANAGCGSRSSKKKVRSDGGGNVGRKQQPKHERDKEEKQSQHGKQKKQKKEESKMEPKPKQDGRRPTGKELKKNEKKKKKVEQQEEEETSAGCRFPLSRVDRIIRSEGYDFRITNEAVFLINKASEKFLEIFIGQSYECAEHDHKKSVSYNHLATAVNKEKRLDFLSDYVPEKVVVEKALAERTTPEEK